MSYEQVLELTKFVRKVGKSFDLHFDLKKLTDWVEEILECDPRDLKAAWQELMKNPMVRVTPAIILQHAKTSKARRMVYEDDLRRSREMDSWEHQKTETAPENFEERLRKGMMKIFYQRGPSKKILINSFLEEMKRDFPEKASSPDLLSIAEELT